MVHLVYCDNAGETLYFMEKGSGKITAKASVRDVRNYVKLSGRDEYSI